MTEPTIRPVVRRPVSDRFPESNTLKLTTVTKEKDATEEKHLAVIREAQQYLRSNTTRDESPLFQQMASRLGPQNPAIRGARDTASFLSSNLAWYPYGADFKPVLRLFEEAENNANIPEYIKVAVKDALAKAGMIYFSCLKRSVAERQAEDNFLGSEITTSRENIRKVQAALNRVSDTLAAANETLKEALTQIENTWDRRPESKDAQSFEAIKDFEYKIDRLLGTGSRIGSYVDYLNDELDKICKAKTNQQGWYQF